jgi:hypothetical protein
MKIGIALLAMVFIAVCPALAAPPAPVEKPLSAGECLVTAFVDGWGSLPGMGRSAIPKGEPPGPGRDACVAAGFWVKIQSDGSQVDAERLTKFAAAIQQERQTQHDKETLDFECFLLSARVTGGNKEADKKEAEKLGCPS